MVTGATGSRRETYRWLYSFVRPNLPALIVVLCLSLLASALGLAQPYLTKLLIDRGLVAGDFSAIVTLALVMLGLAVVGAGIATLNRWHYVSVSGRILFAIRAHIYRHLQTLSPSYFTRTRSGDLMARLDGDIAEVQRFATDSALALVNGVIVLAGALTFMVLLSPLLSLIAFALLPLHVVFLRVVRPRIELSLRDLRAQASGLSSFFYDTLQAMKLIQSVGAERREAERLDGLQARYFGRLRHQQMLDQAASVIPGLFTLAGVALVFVAGGAMVIDKTMTLGTLIAFTGYLTRAVGPVNTLLGLYVALKRAQVSLDRVEEIRHARPDVCQPSAPEALPAGAGGTIELIGVSFAYPGEETQVLTDTSAVFPAGAKVAIAGLSGAGKSTLIDLLQRHYDPGAGRILLDGTDLGRLDLAALRRKVAVVSQETLLLSGSVAENLRYAAPEASDGEVRRAAEMAAVSTFVDALPEGYETELGTRGLRLSGGQRQRIAIARAILQDPLVLILDEATSGVDTETEEAVRRALDTVFSGRTRIVVGHRSTMAEDADLVFELVGGRLIARDPVQERTPAP
ncbi:ABC transporter ATP-binding protein [Kaustia mangrovi]|uniref:ABC transporter ATP-binding protein n=1 Tax=Kaustia mangrovi TaxID=2593653 RepID=A0A7S8C3W3_9HYPH|nr:ABC transporter ATP-binding protein [Kaustia mangrovi]